MSESVDAELSGTRAAGPARTLPQGCFRFSVGASSALVIATAFKWSLIDVVTLFLFFPLIGGLWFALAVSAAWSLVHLVRWRRAGVRAAGPLLVCTLAALAVVFVPFTELWLHANFRLLRERREDVVRKVEAGVLRPNVSYNPSLIALEGTWPTLSMGGNEIIVEAPEGRPYVFFFTFRGILDNYSGFLFVPPEGDPRMFSGFWDEDSTELEAYSKSWYFASHR